MKTIILGARSNLTKSLKKEINNPIIFSSENIEKRDYFKKIPKKFNLIINLFYPTSKLENIDNYVNFFHKNIILSSKFLESINKKKINKIIYTSSASVYGSLGQNISYDNKKLYASSKILLENYIKNFSIRKKKKTIIARVFNMYDENENFSIISKITKKINTKETLVLNNRGESIRDFIHSRDVAKIYKFFLKENISGFFDVGSGYGIKIIDILNNIGLKKFKIKYLKNEIKEENYSVANIEYLKNLKLKIKTLEKYFKTKKIFIKKTFKKYKKISDNSFEVITKKTVLYGAGYSGKKLFDNMTVSQINPISCFIDDNKKLNYTFYKNTPIYNFDSFKKKFNGSQISHLVIAIPSITPKDKLKIIKKTKGIVKKISTLPSKYEIINKIIDYNDIKEIELKDILNRNISSVNNNLIKYLNKSSILITGGAGSIGSEITLQILKTNCKKIVIFDNDETALFNLNRKLENKKIIIPVLGDINDTNYLKEIIQKHKIKHIFHAAAYKHVNLLEKNYIAAIKNNIFGTISLLKSLNDKILTLTIISTDKAAFPKNNLGITKRVSELISQYYLINNKKIKLSIVRFGNVFGSQGSAIEIFINQIKKNIPITITSKKAKRYFMSIKEATNLVLQSVSLKNKKNGIFILNMGKPNLMTTIAKKLLEFFDIYNYPIKFIKLKKGEKTIEKLSISKNKYKTKHKDIFIVNEKKYEDFKVKKLLSFIDTQKNNENYKTMMKYFKFFLEKEIKNWFLYLIYLISKLFFERFL